MEHDLTKPEKLAIASLKRLAKRWPKTLWLYSAGPSLLVMREPVDGNRHGSGQREEGMNPDLAITAIEGISRDGGDW